MDIKEFREKFPQYNDLSDTQLADALHAKFYSDIPKTAFYSRIGLTRPKPPVAASAPIAASAASAASAPSSLEEQSVIEPQVEPKTAQSPALDVTRGAEMRPYTPSFAERLQNLFPDNKARAMNEVAARRIAAKRKIPVSQVYNEAGFNRPMLNPEGRPTIQALAQAAPVIAEELKKTPAGVAETVLRTVRGGNIGVDNSWLDRTIKELSDEEGVVYDQNYSGLQGLGKSLGYSLVTMVSSAVAGTTSAAVSGPAAPIVAPTAAMTAAGAVAYRGSKDEFLDRVKNKLDKQSKKLYGRPLNEDEWGKALVDYDSAASKYGAWEAIPEAVTNVIFLRAFAAPIVGAKGAKLKSIKNKAIALAAENVGETVTALGQNAAELEAELTTQELNIVQAFRQQFVQTMLISGALGGGLKGKELATKFYNERVLPRIDPASALAKAIKADLDTIGYTPAAFRQASGRKIETAPPSVTQARAVPKPIITPPPEEPPETAPPAERIEPTFDPNALLAPEVGGRIEPTLEGAPAAPTTPEERLGDTEGYKLLFNAYRAQGLTREDADSLARRTLQEREALEAKATGAATTAGTPLGISDAEMTGRAALPPVNTWTDANVLATLEFQRNKPAETRNDALVTALERELVARGITEPISEEGETRAGETVTSPSGESAGMAGVTEPGAPAAGLAGTKRTGVVSTATDVGQPAVGKGEPSGAVEGAPAAETPAPDQFKFYKQTLDAAGDVVAFKGFEDSPWRFTQFAIGQVVTFTDSGKTHTGTITEVIYNNSPQRREYNTEILKVIDNDPASARDENGKPIPEQWTLRNGDIQDVTAPTAETPAAETPAAETPAAETPAAETPAAETPAAETPAAETPAAETPKTKRGRPKAELTAEEQAGKEQKRKEGRAAYTKADRQAEKAVKALDELAQPLDESQFATEETLKEAKAERVGKKREAIRTLLQLRSQFRGTALGKRIDAALGRPDISEKEKADILAGIEALKRSGSAPLQSTDPAVRKVNSALATVTNGAQAIAAILKTGSAFQKLVANRIRSFVRNVQVVVVEATTTLPEELRSGENAAAWEGARGLYIQRPDGSQVVYLRGASFGADQGVNNVTALHELLHAATSQKLWLGLLASVGRVEANASLTRFASEITRIMERASKVYAALDSAGRVSPDLKLLVESTLRFDEDGNPYYAIFGFHHEFLAYGMSDPVFQEFLNTVPDKAVEPVSGFSRFVSAIRAVLGMPANATTSLVSLVNATDQILSGRKTPWMRRVEAAERGDITSLPMIAAENKTTKQKVNKAERKIARSRQAQDVIDETGVLTALRNPKGLLDLLAAGWDTFNVVKLKALLPALMTDTIVQWADRLQIEGLNRAWAGLGEMSAMRANMLTASAEVTREWLKLQPGVARKALGAKSEMNALADVMHYSTAEGIDPTRNTTDRTLNSMWAALSPKAKSIYVKVRDSYKAYFDLYRLLLDQRIEALDIGGTITDPDTPKGRLMAEIKKLYETGKAISPYFPLMRYGDYWLSIGKGKEREFYMFESALDRDLFRRARLREAEELGATLDTEQGNSLSQLRDKSVTRETSELLKDIFDVIDEAGADTDKETLKNQIYQLYLTTMPEQSFRQQFIHRKGTTGFSGDALRNYITSTMNLANQLSRLKYGPRVLLDIEAARKTLEGRPDRDKLEMLVDEMKMRADMEIFPAPADAATQGFVNVANRSAFLYYMTSVKTALSQFASLPIFGVPVLLSRHDPVQVLKEMGRFMLVFNELSMLKEENGKTKVVMPTITESKSVKLSPEEQTAIEAMRDRGLADVTLTYDLMDRRQVPTTKYIGAWKTASNMMGALFHHVERLNREVMYITAFRLTMNELAAKNITGPAAVALAIEQAANDTYTALGNFTEGNRPRVARGPVGKLALQFKTFPAFVTTYMVRNFYRMTAGMNKEEKKEAATQFFGTLGMSYLLAGYVGIPGITFAFGAVQALINFFKDEEDEDPLEKKDLETWFRSVWMRDVFGEVKVGDTGLSDIVDAGVLNSISGYDMNSSLSMNNMWFPEVKEGATYMDTWQDYAVSLAGPFAGILLKQVPGAMDDFRAGKFERGVEKLMPNLIRQPMVARRYSKEGATTPAGDVVKEADEFTQGQLVMQALGYRTEGLAAKQTANFKANAIRRAVMNEKNRIVARLDLEFSQGSDEAAENALEEVFKFNSRYPMVAIKGEELTRMLKNRMEARIKSERGFRVDKRYYPYLEELLLPSSEKLEKEAAKK